MRLMKDNLLVKQRETQTTTAGGIILTGETSRGNKPGVVVRVGPDAEGIISEGDTIYIEWDKGFPIEIEGILCSIISAEHIKAII